MTFEQWYATMPSLERDGEAIAKTSWDACKREVLKILRKDMQNLDLSWETCSECYIEKVEKL